MEETWKMAHLVKMSKYSIHEITNTVQNWRGEKKKVGGEAQDATGDEAGA